MPHGFHQLHGHPHVIPSQRVLCDGILEDFQSNEPVAGAVGQAEDSREQVPAEEVRPRVLQPLDQAPERPQLPRLDHDPEEADDGAAGHRGAVPVDAIVEDPQALLPLPGAAEPVDDQGQGRLVRGAPVRGHLPVQHQRVLPPGLRPEGGEHGGVVRGREHPPGGVEAVHVLQEGLEISGEPEEPEGVACDACLHLIPWGRGHALPFAGPAGDDRSK
mmetsp:Transcript_32426/g.78931  ORF Transcript_32426/g.78931 Transcript_32426/m.78931 type:complete len:217 (+) Transcript_32426:1301-1951(+)